MGEGPTYEDLAAGLSADQIVALQNPGSGGASARDSLLKAVEEWRGSLLSRKYIDGRMIYRRTEIGEKVNALLPNPTPPPRGAHSHDR